ncbi:hypothetical protein UlMin_042701 [Ulmus minor]
MKRYDVSMATHLPATSTEGKASEQPLVIGGGTNRKLTPSHAHYYLDSVKNNTGSGKYREFLEIMADFKSGRVDVQCLTRIAEDLFKEHPDLILSFRKFLPKELISLPPKKRFRFLAEQEIDCMNKTKSMYRGDDVYKSIGKRRERKGVYRSEIDLSQCERSSPSYNLLPKNYQSPRASGRTELDAQVLNEVCKQRSFSYSSKHIHKNIYEKRLFQYEDDRFELDMLWESLKSATARAEKLLEEMKDNKFNMERTPIRIEDHFSVVNMRCIERLYGKHGLVMMDAFRENVHVALPVILARLKQKQDELARCRVEFDKVWVRGFAKNYRKSLDCSGFGIKLQDTRSSSTKAGTGEISEERLREDGVLIDKAAGKRTSEDSAAEASPNRTIPSVCDSNSSPEAGVEQIADHKCCSNLNSYNCN